MSILDIFRTAAPAASAAANTTVPSSATPKPGEGGPAAMPATPSVADKEKSPMSGFEELWQPNKDAKAPDALVTPFKIDQKALSEAVSKMDFTSAVTPELAKKALEGDVESFKAAINAAAQDAFAKSAAASGRLTETQLSATVDRLVQERLPAMMKSHSIATHVASENPILDNPAVKPIADVLREQIIGKNPNASPADINAEVRKYLSGFAAMVTAANTAGTTASADGQTTALVTRKNGTNADDWTDFFGASKT